MRRSLFPKKKPYDLHNFKAIIPSRYELITDGYDVDDYFNQLKKTIGGFVQKQRTRQDGGVKATEIFYESGTIAPGRPYFYVKPKDQMGWLFEQSGVGWVSSRCEKIIGRNLFLRSESPWDNVAIYRPQDNESAARFSSSLIDHELISFPLYQELLLKKIMKNEPFNGEELMEQDIRRPSRENEKFF